METGRWIGAGLINSIDEIFPANIPEVSCKGADSSSTPGACVRALVVRTGYGREASEDRVRNSNDLTKLRPIGFKKTCTH